jgi:hypothetical protein
MQRRVVSLEQTSYGGHAHLWIVGLLQQVYTAECSDLHTRRRENLKSHFQILVLKFWRKKMFGLILRHRSGYTENKNWVKIK